MSEPLVPHDHAGDERIAAADAGDGAPVETAAAPRADGVAADAPTSSDADGEEGGDERVARPSAMRPLSGERLAPEQLAAESD